MFSDQNYLFSIFVIALIFLLKNVDSYWTVLESATKCIPENKTWATPNCTFFYRSNALFKTSCLKPAVIRFQGEYESIKITCTSLYLVDFFYYGIQPTEAIEIEYSKIVEPNSNRENITFRVDVTVRSANELQKYFSDTTLFPLDKADIATPTDADYSRSGKYIFNGLFNHSLETTFHIFFEDSVKPSFLRNTKTKASVEKGKLILPCLSSHFDSNVTLRSLENINYLTFSYDPIVGFSATNLGDEITEYSYNGAYKCFMTHGNTSDELFLTFPDSSPADSHFGLRDLPSEMVKDMDIKFDLNVISYDFLDVRPWCQVANLSATNSLLSKVPSFNGGYDRLAREFVFPQYINRSYTVQKVTQPEKLIQVLKIEKISNVKGERGGIAFCMSGSHYDVTDYGIPINYNAVVKFPYGIEWNTLPRNESKIEIHMLLRLESHKKGDVLYENTNLTASCLVLNGSMVKPAIWYTERKNHSCIEEFIDYNVQGFSYFTINLTRDIIKIYCSASYIHTAYFRNTSISVNVIEGMPPVIKTKIYPMVFRLGYRNQFLKCEADGLPTPELYWQDRNRMNISEKSSYSKSILDFEIIEYRHAGEYLCIAKNELGKSVSVFNVEVEKESGNHFVVIFVSFAMVIILAVLLSFLYFQRWKLKRVRLTEEEINEFIDGLIPINNGETTINEYKNLKLHANYCYFDERPYIKEKEIPKNSFKIDQAYVLGSGEYGMVFKGSVNGKEVAVKTAKRNAEKMYLKALLSELKIMIYLGDHQHIVNLIGSNIESLREGLVYIFVEFCPFGSLESFLKFNRHKYLDKRQTSSFGGNDDASQTGGSFCYDDLVNWTKQIAQAMEFLNAKQVIHGDLATRNVLLAKNMQAKVSDFGLSRKMYNYSVYIKKNQEPLPWRWSSLEVLRDMIFSYESDSWSFGITVWEIFSLGEVPYAAYHWSLNFITELENGLRLSRPKYGTELMYQNIMLPCWNELPNRRPSFSNLVNQIEQYGENYMIMTTVDN